MKTLASKTLLVLPALNESEVIASVIREIQQCLPGFDILVVDDGSTDNTGEEALSAGAAVATLPFNLGVGGAMRLGFQYAVSSGYENVVQIDSDGQHDPRNVPELLAGLETHDLVIGARFAGQGEYIVSGPRKWAMKLLSLSLSRVAHTKLTDTTSGFKASGPRAVRLFAAHYPAEYLGDTIEALVIASKAGCSVTQVPVSMRPRAGGVPSHNPLKAGIYLGRAVVALCFSMLRPAIKIGRSSS
jgi:glycosyltransferase involved in cell wall biosynthesis